MTGEPDAGASQWRQEATDVVRALSGGMLFGIPLLYTMEVWWIGSETTPRRMLAVLLVTFGPVLLLIRTSGFRSTRDVLWRDALADSVETVALGLMSVAALLVLLREITSETPLAEALGKIVYEAAPFAIGIAVAQHVLRRGRAQGDEEEGASGGSGGGGAGAADGDDEGLSATIADVGATLVGSLFVAFNVAPTDEVPMLAAAMPPVWLVGVMGASLLASYCIVFVAGFSNQEQRRNQPGILQHPVTETVASYLLSLASAALMLWFFQRIGRDHPFDMSLSHVVVLGLPAAIGGAAGRLAT